MSEVMRACGASGGLAAIAAAALFSLSYMCTMTPTLLQNMWLHLLTLKMHGVLQGNRFL